jgi:hypothetical protein
MFNKLFLFIFLFLLTSPPAHPQALPPVDEVQRVALDYARIRPEELSSFKKRARTAALLPRLQVTAKRNTQDKIDVGINDNVSVTSNGVNIGPSTSQVVQNANDETGFEVKAVWYLNELIFNSDMLAVAEESRYQMRERRALMAEVNGMYFDLERLFQRKDVMPADDFRLRRDEILADLDSLTGGWFSRSVGVK